MATGGVTPPQQPPSADLQAIDQRYRRDVTITEARPILTRVFFGLWAFADVVLLAFFMATVVWYLADGMWSDARVFAAAVKPGQRLHALAQARAPGELLFEDPMVLTAGDRVDLVSELSHEATGWSARVRYKFVWSGGESVVEEAVVLPNITYYATSLGVEGGARDARVTIEDISWEAIDRRLVPDVQAWRDDHMQFDVVSPTVAADLGYEAGKPVSRVDFTLHNRSPFSYWDPTFVVIVRRGRAPAAVTTFVANELRSGERRPISLRFFDVLPAGATVDVYPRINFLDPKVYLGPNDAPVDNLSPDDDLPVVREEREFFF